jgi:tetratricopeptide (TPR) repeat protein
MSPEQVLGDPERVDSRSDVYALGLLLYRLLTGRAPHDLTGLTLPQVAVLLAEADPTPASRHDASLRGDLDTILATALARDVERRYASTDQLAAEVRRVLADEPIHARAPTAWYQLTKFARRHRGLVAGLALSFVLLVVAVIGTTAGFLRASQARDDAVDERDRARAINAFLDRMLASAQPELLGLDARLSDLLALAGAELQVDADLSPTVRAALQVTLGRTNLALGRLEQGLEQLGPATRTFAERDGPEAATTLDARSYLANALMDLGRLDEAREQLAEVERAVAAVEDAPAWMQVLPARLQGELFETAGDWAAAAASYRAVEAALKAQPDLDRDTLASVLSNLATPLMELGENDEALEVLLEAQALRESLVGPEHPSTLALRNNLAMQLNQIGRSAESVQRMEPLVEQAERELGPRHNLTLTIRNNYATSLSDAGSLEEALAVYEDVHRRQEDSLGPAHRDTLITRNNLASTLLYLERPAEAVEQLRWILDALQRSEAGDDPVFRLRVEMNLAAGLMNQELNEEALPVATRVVETLEELAGEGHIQALISRNNLAMLLLQMGRFDEAERHARRNLELAREHQPGHPVNVFPFQMNFGRALAAAGRLDEAEPVLLDVARALEEDPDALAANRARIAEVLAETYDAWDRPEDAALWRAQNY